MNDSFDYLEPSTYSGAPDECNIHWPTKLVDGFCPKESCSHNRKRVTLSRFYLVDGQFFAHNVKNNIWWYLNGYRFGFGDLREKDIRYIRILIEPGEVFEGYHEAHGTNYQQCENALIRIDSGGVTFPKREPLSEETRARINRSIRAETMR